MTNSDDDDDDWFNKDEDQIFEEFKKKLELRQAQEAPEVITTSRNQDDLFLNEQRLQNSNKKVNHAKISTADLRKLTKLNPLEMFLHMTTEDNANFFSGQIMSNDSTERFFLYIDVLTNIISLQLAGFHEEILCSLSKDTDFMNQVRAIAIKIFNKKHEKAWKVPPNGDTKYDIEKLIWNLFHIFQQFFQYKFLTNDVRMCLEHIRKLILLKNSTKFAKLCTSLKFADEIKIWLDDHNDEGGRRENKEFSDLYPTLNDLLTDVEELPENHEINTKAKYANAYDYLREQARMLREAFLEPLRSCFKEIKARNSHSLEAMQHVQLFKDVKIILNIQFLQAKRQEFIFVDILGTRRSEFRTSKEIKEFLTKENYDLSKFKNGALLCLFTNEDISDLILSIVTYTDVESLEEGYIGIEILRQYNLGDIYNKQFFMLETPAFFEPYRNVYNYLTTCDSSQIPMEDYIVHNKSEVKAPTYLKDNALYTYRGKSFDPRSQVPEQLLTLNESQRVAYKDALSHEMALIHGPPGTGKTHLSVHLVDTLIQNVKKPIILITYTNESLDKFLLKLSRFTNDIVRFGYQSKQPAIAQYNIRDYIDKEILPQRLRKLFYLIDLEYKATFKCLQDIHTQFDGTDESYKNIVAAQTAVQKIGEKLQTLRFVSQYYVARNKSIVAMTTTCAARINFLFRLLQSPVVVFEEAAEIHESHIVACLTPFTEHVIMIGDHMQLKPFSISSSFQHGTDGDRDSHMSLFERLICKTNLKPATLKIQYRMRKEIAELLCPTIYEELETQTEDYPNVEGMTENLYFLTHEHEESRAVDDISIYNAFEVNACVELAKHLLVEGQYEASDIVILSPYAKQVARLNALISSKPPTKGIRVSTVDSFQGLEAKIVILSLVRCNKQQQIGFLKEQNRVCVALSRAQHGLYMIGNIQLLANKSSTWQEIKMKLESKNLIGASFPYLQQK